MTANQLVAQWRKSSTLTLNALSQRAGVSVPFLSDIEHGRRHVSLKAAVSLAAALEQPAHEVVQAVLQDRLDAAGLSMRVEVAP